MGGKRKGKKGILISIFVALILGILIILCGGACVGIGIKTWVDNGFYSFNSDIVGTVHTNYPEIEEQVLHSLINRDCVTIKIGRDMLYDKGYSGEAFERKQAVPSRIIGMVMLMVAALIVASLLFWKDVFRTKRRNIYNIRLLIGVGIASVIILLSGIKIGEILSNWNGWRYYSLVAEVTGSLANADTQKNQAAEKFIKALQELEHTDSGYSILKEYGYDYQDFEYEGGFIVFLSGMLAITPLALYFIMLYLYMQRLKIKEQKKCIT